jgi:hypothetical protein
VFSPDLMDVRPPRLAVPNLCLRRELFTPGVPDPLVSYHDCCPGLLARLLYHSHLRGFCMRLRGKVTIAIAVLVAGLIVTPSVGAQARTSQLVGAVHLSRDVIANGQRLPAGTYAVRSVDTPVKPVVGQTLSEYKWVEFVQGAEVKGREIAVVLTGPPAQQVIKTAKPPIGKARVDLLRGDEYVRVWINSGGQHFLVHLATAGKPSLK